MYTNFKQTRIIKHAYISLWPRVTTQATNQRAFVANPVTHRHVGWRAVVRFFDFYRFFISNVAHGHMDRSTSYTRTSVCLSRVRSWIIQSRRRGLLHGKSICRVRRRQFSATPSLIIYADRVRLGGKEIAFMEFCRRRLFGNGGGEREVKKEFRAVYRLVELFVIFCWINILNTCTKHALFVSSSV